MIAQADRPDDVVHLSVPGAALGKRFTPDHYYLLLCAGRAGAGEGAQVSLQKRVLGSVSMTGYRLG